MRIKVGYELVYDCPQPTPMMLMLSVHPSRAADLLVPDSMKTDPALPIGHYVDGFGNICSRLVAPAGRTRIHASGVVRDSGELEEQDLTLPQLPVQVLPDECLVFVLGSRYCETDRLSEEAWRLFGNGPTGAARVQAICDWVHDHIGFDYQQARPTRTAAEALAERQGVCRDYAHLAVAFCRAMNIPARYCTGYLGDIGVPVTGPMDFAAWFEAYLGGPRGGPGGGKWVTFDPRNNQRRIGRILIARGRDAADVAISNTFGPNILSGFTVVADEIEEPAAS